MPKSVLFHLTRSRCNTRFGRANQTLVALLLSGVLQIVAGCRDSTAPDQATRVVWTTFATLNVGGPGSNAGSLIGIWGASARDIWVVGTDGLIRHYDGTTWSAQASGTSSLGAVWGSSATDVWAAGYETILHYDGTNWSVSHASSLAHFSGVWGSSPSDVRAVGFSDSAHVGIVAHYDGTSWTTSYLTATDEPSAVWGASASDVWAVGTRGSYGAYFGLLMHNDGGSWSSAFPTVSPRLFGVWGSSRSFVVAAGINDLDGSGVVLAFDGSKWSTSWTGFPGVYVTSVNGTSTTNVWAAGSIILHFGGRHWSAVPSPTAGALYGVWTNSASHVWVVGGNRVYLGSLPQ